MVEKLETIGAKDLSQETFPPIKWFAENLLGPGCYLLASLPKTGKGFWTLGLGLAITEGKPFLDTFPTYRSGVCILGLEDRLRRLQSRLWQISDDPSNDLRLAERSERLDTGLIQQLEVDLAEHPETAVYVVDTYAAVMAPGSDFGYKSDYDALSQFTNFAEEHGVCVVVCHHCKKDINPAEPFLSISGTSGVIGAVTGMVVIHGDNKCCEGEFIMSVQAKDVPRARYKITLGDCVWRMIEPLTEEQIVGRSVPNCVNETIAFMATLGGSWRGSAAELAEAVQSSEERPDVFGKFLAQHRDYMARCGVAYERRHTRNGNVLTLDLIPSPQ